MSGAAQTSRGDAFRAALANGFVFFDGSMGALLQSRGTKTAWKLPEELNVNEPETILAIHRQYLDAGATVVLTNTFGGTKCKLEERGLDPADINARAVRIAKEAVSGYEGRFVALDIGPTGKLLEPMGDFPFDAAYEAFAEQVRAGVAAGADLIAIETMDLYELKAAVLAAKEHSSIPVIASATFQANNRTLTGADPATVVATMEGLGVDAVGFNCGNDLAHARELAADFLRWASVPVFMEPNAGIPVVENGKTVFKVTPAEFAETLAHCAKLGVRILGGCCGTTPAHIGAAAEACAKIAPVPVSAKDATVISSWSRAIVIGAEAGGTPLSEGAAAGPIIIGERINPTGKKKFKEALLAGDINYILSEAQSQIDAGAHVLDVNVGLPGIDEAAVMSQAMKALQRTFQIPLQIDSSEPAVLERALRHYIGKPLVNSVNGKRHVMDEVFPIVKKYGGVVVALALDEDGIPPTAEGRLAVARKIVETAEAYGIARKNVIVDTLTLTVSSQQKEAMETVRALSLVKRELGVKTVLGVSNISFGLPQRELVNSVFFGNALGAGLDACIINPLSAQMMAVYRSYRALAGFDENCLEYIDVYSKLAVAPAIASPAAVAAQTVGSTTSATGAVAGAASLPEDDLRSLIVRGMRDRSRTAAEKLLETKTPVEIIDGYIVPALDEVGKDFEKGRKFLPQLLLSADTVARAFDAIKEHLERTGTKTEQKGKILIATVEGDIHDIGKNIVKAMLENYGYQVVDLGKDVPVETVIESARRETPGIVGLSALMTTTVANMERTIARIREEKLPVRVMVGGAVLTPEYAAKIGADYYGKDAMASVNIAKEVFGI